MRILREGDDGPLPCKTLEQHWRQSSKTFDWRWCGRSLLDMINSGSLFPAHSSSIQESRCEVLQPFSCVRFLRWTRSQWPWRKYGLLYRKPYLIIGVADVDAYTTKTVKAGVDPHLLNRERPIRVVVDEDTYTADASNISFPKEHFYSSLLDGRALTVQITILVVCFGSLFLPWVLSSPSQAVLSR